MAELLRRDPDDSPAEGVVLMLHGGAQSGRDPVDHRSASLRRTRWMFDTIAPEVLAAGQAICLLRFSVRGWNSPSAPSPVPDARAALDEIRSAYGEAPVVILGHSMGARTAVHVADDPSVIGVVGLAPWFSPSDPVRTLAGKHLVAGHGRTDKITRAAMTRAYVERAKRAGCDAQFHDLGRVGHYMLRRIPMWNTFATQHSLQLLAQHSSPRRR